MHQTRIMFRKHGRTFRHSSERPRTWGGKAILERRLEIYMEASYDFHKILMLLRVHSRHCLHKFSLVLGKKQDR